MTHPQEIRDGGEDRDDVIINGLLAPEQIVEEVQHPGVDAEEGQADVEGDVHGEREQDAGYEGSAPGPRLEHELQIDNSHHSRVHTETETELAKLIWKQNISILAEFFSGGEGLFCNLNGLSF